MKSLKTLGFHWNSSPIDGPPKSAAGVLSHAEETSLNNIWINITKSEAGFQRLYSESQKYQHAIKEVQGTETKLVKSFCDSNIGNFSEELHLIGDEYLSTVNELKDSSKYMEKRIQDYVVDVSKPYYNMYEHVNNYKKRRDQSLSEFQKCQDKYDKLKLKGKRTTDVLVEKDKKFRNLREVNSKLFQNTTQFHESRIPFLDVTLEGLVHSQVEYYGNTASEYNQQIKTCRKGHTVKENDYNTMMKDCFDRIKQLDIVDA